MSNAPTPPAVSHDLSMVRGETHALSIDCPCRPDLEAGVVYHLPEGSHDEAIEQ